MKFKNFDEFIKKYKELSGNSLLTIDEVQWLFTFWYTVICK